MPPRKEAKETVTYPASKRKPPPFKPQRPSQAPRAETVEPVNTARRKTSNTAKDVIGSAVPARKGTSKQLKAAADRRAAQTSKKTAALEISSDEDDDASDSSSETVGSKNGRRPSVNAESESDDGLPAPNGKRKRSSTSKEFPTRDSLVLIDSSQHSDPDPAPDDAVIRPMQQPNDLGALSPMSQPLLIRLLYEHFQDKSSKIDKHAIQVLQKYFEVFVREAVTRAAFQKREDVASGLASQSDVGWLELQDLEKVAPGLLMDF